MPSPSDRKPTYLLGMGAQKAGTTWIYRYLSDNRLVDFGGVKEWHAWTAFFAPRSSARLVYLRRALDLYQRAEGAQRRQARSALDGELRLLQTALDPRRYRERFRKLAAGGKPVGDMTPNYPMLERGHLETAVRFMSEKFSVKALFVMRDPVDRCFSMYKHYARRGLLEQRRSDPADAFRKALSGDELPGGRDSDYERTVRMIDSVFPEEDRLYLFYEDLFTEASIRRLTGFLGVDYAPPLFDVRHNDDKLALDLPADLAVDAARRLSGVYRFVASRFGALPAHWRDRVEGAS